MQRCRLLFLCSFIFHIVSAQAASISDIRTNYPSDFGKVLIGSVNIAHNSVLWTGKDVATRMYVLGGYVSFGLTGNALYALTDMGNDITNQWVMESPQSAVLITPQPNGNAPSMGYFFAPNEVGLRTETTSYEVDFPNQPSMRKMVTVQGIGIPDSEANPILTLDAKIQGGDEVSNCEDMKQCKYVNVPIGGEVSFTITPKSSQADIQYIYAVVNTDKVNVNCTNGNTPFKEKVLPAVNFDPNDYFHILNGSSLTGEIYSTCGTQETPIIVSANKSFQFKVINQQDTKSGYTQYRFYVNGHWDINDLNNTKWSGSQQVFRLRTSKSTSPVQPSTGNITTNITTPNVDTPVLDVNKTTLTFSNTQLTNSITLSNSGTGILNVSQISLGGADKADFQTTGCEAAKLAATQTCTLSVTLKVPVDPSRLRSANITINSDVGNKTIQLNSDYPVLTTPMAFDKDGNSVTMSNAAMTGGLSVNNQAFGKGGNLNLADIALITAHITPADEHVGNSASMFMTAGYVPNGTYADCKNKDKSTFYYLLSRSGNTYCKAPRKLGTEAACQGQALYSTPTATAGVWDGNLSTLGTLDDAQNIILSKTPIELKMWEGNFEAAGVLCIWFGYRVPDGTVVVSGESINLTVNATPSLINDKIISTPTSSECASLGDGYGLCAITNDINSEPIEIVKSSSPLF